MRLLFSAVSAHGHVLPLVPFAEAAVQLGHDVSVVVSPGMADVLRDEFPRGVEHLPVGPMPVELAREAARRTGEDVMAPSVDGIGETFGGVLLDLAADAAIDLARTWRADIVISEMYCTVGPVIAAALGLPWHEVRMTAAIPADWAIAIERAAARRYRARELEPVPATGALDLWPPLLRDPDQDRFDPKVPVLPVRARAHRRPVAGASTVPAPASGRPRVLVTMGTTFSDGDTLAAVVDAVAENPVDVTATRGIALQGGPVAGEDRRGTAGGEVTFVSFVPIDALLDGVAAVVGIGGAGTVLAALSRGIPLVLWPLGADQPAIAARVDAAGAGIAVAALPEIGSAVARVLASPDVRDHAEHIAASIAEATEPQDAIRMITGPGNGSCGAQDSPVRPQWVVS